MREIVRLNGLSRFILSDRNVWFKSHFLRTFWKKMAQHLSFPRLIIHTHNQTEVVNHSLGNLSQCLVRDHMMEWDLVLSIVEFACNSLVRSSGLSPFEVVTDCRPRKPINLLHMSLGDRSSASTKSFAQHLHELHDKIHR